MKIANIERILLDVPFTPISERNMRRSINGWHIVELCRVTTDSGHVGWGETLPNYTWGRVTDAAVARATGANPFTLMWDDSLGAGLQMALLDVAGKIAEVPVHRLLGRKVRDWCPISWWNIDMSAADFASEAATAVANGYTSIKQKARPWWDVYEQVEQTAAVAPTVELDLDFNRHLRSAPEALQVLLQLDQYRSVAIYEEPISPSDIDGCSKLQAAIGRPLAQHYGHIGPLYRGHGAGGWVVSGGVTSVMRAAGACAELNMPFWLQLVGSGWTTTLAAHLGAVCSHARWPAVTCLNVYEHQLLSAPITVKGGCQRVPQGIGLGIDFDESALQWRVETSLKPSATAANDQAIYAVVRADGTRVWYDSEMNPTGYWPQSHQGNLPVAERGAQLETWENDGSAAWRDLAARVKEAPVLD